MLPPPKDPFFSIVPPTEEEYLRDRPDWVEDEDLIATGAWDDYDEDDDGADWPEDDDESGGTAPKA